MKKVIFKRDLFQDLVNSIDKAVCVIHGARQVGKTTLMYAAIDFLRNEKNIEETQITFLDLEDPQILDLCNSGYEKVLKYLIASGVNLKKDAYLFIDEIQYLDNPSSFIKLLYDHASVRLLVSGSSSFAIKSKFTDSLVGRTLNFELYGLSFPEFLRFKQEEILLKNVTTDVPQIVTSKLKNLFKEYVLFGGYPKVVLENDVSFKKKYLQQIIDTYVKKDIADIANIRDIRKFNNLLKILAGQTGNLLNISELSKTIGLNRETIDKYLFIMENTYIIKLLYPYSKDPKVELSKMPKLYFEDTGLLSILANYNFFNDLTGTLFENGIYVHLRKFYDNLNYWRTKQGQEVDFIITTPDELHPLEVKINSSGKTTALRSFISRYKLPNGYFTFFEGQKYSRQNSIHYLYPWEIQNFF